jgi:hypothetical protein
MGKLLHLSEAWDYLGAIKEHWVGGLLVAAPPAVVAWVVSRLEPYAARGNRTAALLVAILNDLRAWIARHRYALISNSFLFGIIFAAFLAYTDTNQQLKNPITISFEWENNRPFLEHDASDELWIRVMAHNVSTTDFVCRVYLNALEKDGETKPLLMQGDTIELLWAGSDYESPTQAAGDRTVPAGAGKIFNLAYIKKGANELSIQPPQFSNQISEKLSAGIYKFTIQARYSACRSDPTDFVVKYEGQRQVSFIKGR